MRRLLIATLIALAAPAAGSADTAATSERSCFSTSHWRGWSAAAAGDAIYIRTVRDEVYRIDVAPGANVRRGLGDFLVSEVRGSGWVCSPLDLDLTIANEFGIRYVLIPRDLRRLSEAEVAALAPEERPT